MLLQAESCLPKSSVEIPTLTTSEWDRIWRWDHSRGHQVTMRSLGWMLTQFDWCPYRRGQFGHTHRKNATWAWRWPSTSQGGKPGMGHSPTAFRRNQPCPHSHLRLPDSRTLRQQMSVVCINRSVSSAVAAPRHWHRQPGPLPSPGTLRPTQSHSFNHFSSSPLISGPKIKLLILSFILFCFKYFRMTVHAVLKLSLYK